jgi:hypothetical protein
VKCLRIAIFAIEPDAVAAEPFATFIGPQEDPMKIEILRLEPHEWIPNHPSLPVVLYRNALMPTDVEATAAGFETMFRNHGWPPQWRNGVYDYHHYHSTAHGRPRSSHHDKRN